jgi:hypothetical protein
MSLDDDSFLWPEDTSGAALLAPAEAAASETAAPAEAASRSTSSEDESFLWPGAAGGGALEPTLSHGNATAGDQGAAAGDGDDSFLFPEEPALAVQPQGAGDDAGGGCESEASGAPAWPAPTGAAEPGSLAAKVMNLRVLEDDMAALLDETERALRSLESERTLEDAGFPSAEAFRERVSVQMGLLSEMREPGRRAPPATGKVRRRSQSRARGGDMRARRTLALTAIEQTMNRFRELDLVMRGKVEEARDVLADIDRERTFAECGYASFGEFLELAIGPSPILTKCLTVLGAFPPPARRKEVPASEGDDDELPSLAEPPGPRPSDDRPPALFELPAESSSEPAATSEAPAEAAPAKASRRRVLPPRSALVVSIALGIAAAAVGAVAGVRVSHPAPVAPAAVEPTAAPAARPEAAARPLPGAQVPAPEPRRGPMAQLTSLAPASSVRHVHDERPAPTPAPSSSR